MWRGDWDYTGPRIAWGRALNALDNHRPSFYYFYLKHAPEELGKPGYNIDVPHDQGKGGIYRLGFRSYEQVQHDIKDWMNHIYDTWNTQSVDRTIERIKNHLEEKQSAARKKEIELFTNIMKKVGLGYGPDIYYKMCNKSMNFAKNQNTENQQTNEISEMSSIDFWTKASYNLLEGNDALKDKIQNDKNFACKFAASIALKSRNIYDELTKNFSPSFFSRHAALKYAKKKGDNEITKEQIDNLGNEVDKKALEILLRDMDAFVASIEDENVSATLRQIFSTARRHITGTGEIGSKERIPGYLIEGFAKKGGKVVSAATVSARIRKDITDEIKKLIKEGKLSDKAKEQIFGTKNSIDFGEGTDVYFTIPMNQSMNGLYEAVFEFRTNPENFGGVEIENFKKMLAEDKNLQEQVTTIIFNELKEAVKEMQIENVINFLDAGSFKIENYYKSKEDFIAAAVQALDYSKDNTCFIINKSVQTKDFYKNFATANSNQYVSGFLGELGTIFPFETLLQETGVTWTGSSYNEFGQSANDLRWKEIGLQVKHAVAHTGSVYTLYENSPEISIKGDNLRRYLGWEDLQLIRFIAGNAGFFETPKQQLEQISTRIAYYHIDSFYRINVFNKKEGMRDTSNMFFEIANVVYPSSYIYDCALSQIDRMREEDALTKTSALLQTKVSSGNNYDSRSYDNINEAKKQYKLDDYRVSNNYKDLKTDIKFKTKGLKVNLVKLALFSE